MATVTGITKNKALALWAASVKSATINSSGHIIFTRMDDSTFDGGDFSTVIGTLIDGEDIPGQVAAAVSARFPGAFFDQGTKGASWVIKDISGMTASKLHDSLIKVTLSGNPTISTANLPTGCPAGTRFQMVTRSDATTTSGANRLLLAGTGVKVGGGAGSALSINAGYTYIVSFLFDGTTWFMMNDNAERFDVSP